MTKQSDPPDSSAVGPCRAPRANDGTQASSTEPRPAVFGIGDSISIDYHNRLRELARGHYAYARKGGLKAALKDLDRPEGANAGNSEQVLDYLQQTLAAGEIDADVLLINCGLHDIKRETARHPTAIQLEAYKANLLSIIQLVRRYQKKLIWVTTTPVDEIHHRKCLHAFYRYEKDLADYNATALEIMSKHQIPVIDLCSFTEKQPNPYRDHVHFRPAVVERQAAFIHEQLLQRLKTL